MFENSVYFVISQNQTLKWTKPPHLCFHLYPKMKKSFWYEIKKFRCVHGEFTHLFSLFFSRSVYDGQEHGLFMEKLDARIRNHDREIEKMCNHHFQGFVDSITELLKVRGEAQKLKVWGDGQYCVIKIQVLLTCLLFMCFSLCQSQVIDTNRRLQDEGKEVSWSWNHDINFMVLSHGFLPHIVSKSFRRASVHVNMFLVTSWLLLLLLPSLVSSPSLWRSWNSVECNRETSLLLLTNWRIVYQVTPTSFD